MDGWMESEVCGVTPGTHAYYRIQMNLGKIHGKLEGKETGGLELHSQNSNRGGLYEWNTDKK